jgi:hypothetical protein
MFDDVDLNIIEHRKLIPTACQKPISGRLNIWGMSQFHRIIRGKPIRTAAIKKTPITVLIAVKKFCMFILFLLI